MSNSNSLFSILILVIPIAAVFYFISKRKKNKTNSGFDGTPKKAKKDEVWQTIKKFMSDSGERGKEVVYSFVAKRPNPLQEKKIRKIYTAETNEYIKKNNLDKKAAKRYKAQRTKEASRELYCIYFVSRNSKTQQLDKARIFEAEVVQKLTGDKKVPTKRVIVINGLKDFETEFQWIEPLKKREDDRIEKIKKQRLAKEAKKKAKQMRRTGKSNFTEQVVTQEEISEFKSNEKVINIKKEVKLLPSSNDEYISQSITNQQTDNQLNFTETNLLSEEVLVQEDSKKLLTSDIIEKPSSNNNSSSSKKNYTPPLIVSSSGKELPPGNKS